MTSFSQSRILVEVGKYFATRPVILLTELGITTTCRENSTLHDDPTADAIGVLGDDTMFGPIHDAKNTPHNGRYGIEVQFDSVSGDGTKSWVVISRGADRCVAEVSAGCKQSMHPETVSPQDESSSTERLVEGVGLATRSKAKASPLDNCGTNVLPVKLPPPHLTVKSNSLLNIKGFSRPHRIERREIPCLNRRHRPSWKKPLLKAVPMHDIPVKARAMKRIPVTSMP